MAGHDSDSESSRHDPAARPREAPEHDPASAPGPRIAGEHPARVEAPERGASDAALVLLVAAPVAVALLLVLVILPFRDGMKARDSAEDTYFEFSSMSFSARWEAGGEIDSVRDGVRSGLSSLDSELWSVESGLGSLAFDGGTDSRSRIRELEDAIDAHRGELRRLESSADDRFKQLRRSVEAQFEGLEEAADAALDAHWDEAGQRFSRDGWIMVGATGVTAGILLVFGAVGALGCRARPTLSRLCGVIAVWRSNAKASNRRSCHLSDNGRPIRSDVGTAESRAGHAAERYRAKPRRLTPIDGHGVRYAHGCMQS